MTPPIPSPPPPPPHPAADLVCEPGRTETKDLTEDDSISQICDLVGKRLPRALTPADGNVNYTTLVVTVPLRRVILQSGPMCGIVALAEALQMLSGKTVEDPEFPKKLLDTAIKEKLTKQGEMFSMIGIKSLAEKTGSCYHSEILLLKDDENRNDMSSMKFQKVVKHLLQGYPALFPYDADYNHSPALRKGHAAHWAVVHGIACQIPQSKVQLFSGKTSAYQVLHSSQDLTVLKPIIFNTGSTPDDAKLEADFEELVNLFDSKASYGIAHQGKSFHTALWSFTDLFESNCQLTEIAPKIKDNLSDFICDDIVDGLCSKVLLLKK